MGEKHFGDFKVGKYVFNPFNLNIIECIVLAVLFSFVSKYLFFGMLLFWWLKTGLKGFGIINTGE